MKTIFKLPSALLTEMRTDLARAHPVAAERVGFVRVRCALGPQGELILLAQDYRPVDEEDYIDSRRFGALIGSAAFRKELGTIYFREVGLFHVHLHDHSGHPEFSKTDTRESSRFVPDFFNARPNRPHGTLLLSQDEVIGRIWFSRSNRPRLIDRTVVVGNPMQEFHR
jgi:hypothetical protein